jgi:hypothetical protein
MIRYDKHRLFGEIQAAEFHRGGGHGPGLAGLLQIGMAEGPKFQITFSQLKHK